MRLIPDSIDFSMYEQEAEIRQRVRPMSEWRDQVAELLRNPPAQRGKVLPWPKTQSLFRLRPGELTIWAGENRAGKSALLNLVTMGLAAQGEKCLIVSLEMKPADTIDRALRQYARTDEPTIASLDSLMAWSDERMWLYDYVGALTVRKLLPALRWSAAELGITHVVIDSLMRLGTGETDYDAQKAAIDALCTLKHDTGLHLHLVAHSRKPAQVAPGPGSRYDVKGSGTISDLADNVIIVARNDKKERAARDGGAIDQQEPDTLLLVDKQRHGSAWTGAIKLWYWHPAQSWSEKAPEFGSITLPDVTQAGAM